MARRGSTLHGRRVLVALDTAAPDLHVLRTAVRLASRTAAEVVVIVVEDENLVRLGELPIAAEVGWVAGSLRAFDASDVSRMVRARARLTVRELGRLTREVEVSYSVEIRGGGEWRRALSETGEHDVVLMNTAAAWWRPRTDPRRGGIVVWFPDRSGGSERALSAAMEVAGSLDVSLLILVPAGDRAHRDRQLAAAMSKVAAGPVAPGAVSCFELDEASMQATLRTLRSGAYRLLVMSRGDRMPGIESLEDLRRQVGCPIALVG